MKKRNLLLGLMLVCSMMTVAGNQYAQAQSATDTATYSITIETFHNIVLDNDYAWTLMPNDTAPADIATCSDATCYVEANDLNASTYTLIFESNDVNTDVAFDTTTSKLTISDAEVGEEASVVVNVTSDGSTAGVILGDNVGTEVAGGYEFAALTETDYSDVNGSRRAPLLMSLQPDITTVTTIDKSSAILKFKATFTAVDW